MNILYSTEEQRPWAFDQPGVSVQRKKLRTGDYTVAGLEDLVTIERKSLTDLCNTVIHDWLRFVKELRRMGGMEAAVVAVEATPDQLYAHNYTSEANPDSVMGRCHAIALDYGVPVTWWGSRDAAQRAAYQFLQLAAKKFG